jgi:hypothetical protein
MMMVLNTLESELSEVFSALDHARAVISNLEDRLYAIVSKLSEEGDKKVKDVLDGELNMSERVDALRQWRNDNNYQEWRKDHAYPCTRFPDADFYDPSDPSSP